MSSPYIVGIRFQKVGKIYHFDASNCPEIQPGDFAVVETTRGRQLGEVILIVKDPQPPPEGSWKSILRRATPQDLVLRQSWQQKEVEAMINCRAESADMKLSGVKIVAAEFSFDGARLSFLYSTEAEDKVDLRALRRAMQRLYPHTQVEMHQIGPRDVAKILGGMGACGLENRCCSMFLTDFSPVSIKMAKEQGISLTPSEITGMCGRLRCCLIYEYEQYVEARKSLPKRGKRVVTPRGEGKVVDIYPLRQAVLVEIEQGVVQEYGRDEIQPYDELEALRQKAEAPCDRHENGGCNCGKNGAPIQATPEATGSAAPEGFQQPERPAGRKDPASSPSGSKSAGEPFNNERRSRHHERGGRKNWEKKLENKEENPIIPEKPGEELLQPGEIPVKDTPIDITNGDITSDFTGGDSTEENFTAGDEHGSEYTANDFNEDVHPYDVNTSDDIIGDENGTSTELD